MRNNDKCTYKYIYGMYAHKNKTKASGNGHHIFPAAWQRELASSGALFHHHLRYIDMT